VRSQPRLTPAFGSHWLWNKWRYFRVKRQQLVIFESSGTASFKDQEVLTLSCFGQSIEPIRELLDYARLQYYHGYNAKTVIKCLAVKEMRRFGSRCWIKLVERLCREIGTVVLDDSCKSKVLHDINEYLNPATARWYANRRILYRCGYLFYGLPGTGKTLLTFAIAGIFGLDIHVISLLEPTLTEEELGTLFNNLLARCIVLLEDIDTAGLLCNLGNLDVKILQQEADSSAGNDLNVTNLAKVLSRANQLSEDEKRKGIILSGLLNVIDGKVFSKHEY
jgi:chaperone BCS1